MESNGLKKISLMVISIIIVLSAITLIDNNYSLNEGNRESQDLNNRSLGISKLFGKIHIDNNWSTTKIAGICTGSGTESDPYLIKDLEIDGEGSGSCILIENTEDYFIIENCTVSNCGDDTYDAAIKLISVRNGNLTNNRATSPDAYGVILERCINNVVAKNIFIGKNGIRFFASNSNIIYLNDNSQTTFIGLEYRLSVNNRFHTPKKMIYIFNDKEHKSYLGNYWWGYRGDDKNNDGIGEEPLILDQHEPSSEWIYVDYYPLIATIDNYEIIGVATISEDIIPGYSLLFLIGLVSITSIVILSKLNKTIKQN